MLVSIDASGNSQVVAGNTILLTLNSLRAIKAVANAAAGSTPAANAITQSNTLFTSATILPGSNTILTPLTTVTGTAVATGMFVQSANGTGITPGSYVTALNSATVSSGGTVGSATYAGTLTISGTSGQFTLGTASVLAVGQMITITGTPSGGSITGYTSPTSYIVSATNGTTTFTLVNTNGTAITTTTGSTTGLTLTYNTWSVTTVSAGSISNGMFLTGSTGGAAIAGYGTATGGTSSGTYLLTTTNPGTVSSTSATSYTLSSASAPWYSTGTLGTPSFVGPATSLFTLGNNMITVIANTEAGGWLLDANNSVNDGFYSVNATVNSLVLDLYNTATNKTSYPYHKISIVGGATVSPSAITPANSAMLAYHGAANGLSFSNTTSGFWGAGSATIGTTIPSGPSAMVNQRTTYTGTYMTSYNWMGTDFQYILACNASYMHILSNNFIMCMGLRDNQAWEDNYPDNPYVVNFSADTRYFQTYQAPAANASTTTVAMSSNAGMFVGQTIVGNNVPAATTISSITGATPTLSASFTASTSANQYFAAWPTPSVYFPASSFMYTRTVSNTGGFNSAALYRNSQTANAATANVNPVTGQNMTNVASIPMTFDILYARTRTPAASLFQLDSHYLGTTLSNYALPVGYGPTYDPTTSTFVPPAYPVVMQINTPQTYTSGGKLKGIYKSLSSGANVAPVAVVGATGTAGSTTLYVSNTSALANGQFVGQTQGIQPFTTVTGVTSTVLGGTLTITGTAGQFSIGTASSLLVGQLVTITGTATGGSITGYTSGTTYMISATNGSTTFTLVTLSGAAITTTAAVTTGLTLTIGSVSLSYPLTTTLIANTSTVPTIVVPPVVFFSNTSQMNMTNYFVPGATYTVDGDPYYPAAVSGGNDLFLVRRA